LARLKYGEAFRELEPQQSWFSDIRSPTSVVARAAVASLALFGFKTLKRAPAREVIVPSFE